MECCSFCDKTREKARALVSHTIPLNEKLQKIGLGSITVIGEIEIYICDECTLNCVSVHMDFFKKIAFPEKSQFSGTLAPADPLPLQLFLEKLKKIYDEAETQKKT